MKYIFLLTLFFSLSTAAQTVYPVVCDKETRAPLEAVTVLALDANRKIVGTGMSGSNGSVVLGTKKAESIVSFRFSRIGYRTETIGREALPDTLFLLPDTQLDEVEVTATRSLIKLQPGKLAYEVEKDPDAEKSNLFDLMHKVPLLIVSRHSGSITAEGEKSIVYQLNGMRDPLLSGNIENVLSALEARSVKRVEVVTQPGVEYGPDVLVVNIVTKGKIEGYSATLSSSASDRRWHNVLSGMTKYKKLMLSGNYANLWNYDHRSKSITEEHRENSADYYLLRKERDDSGFRSNGHSIELWGSYDINDYALLCMSARAILNSASNPHQDVRETAFMQRSDGTVNYAYSKFNHRLFKNSEYIADISYERLLGRKGEEGKFFIGYEYYSRPFDQTVTERYEAVDSLHMTPGSLEGHFNYVQRHKATQGYHTGETEYWRKFGEHHKLTVGAKYVMRPQSDEYVLDVAPLSSTDGYVRDETGTNRYTHHQHLLSSHASYSYTTSKFSTMGGLVYEYQRDKLRHSVAGHDFTKTFHNVLPRIDLAYVCSNKVSLELAYGMGVLRPDIFALDPYIDRTTAMQLSYGNQQLKPEKSHTTRFTANLNLGRYTIRWYLAYQHTADIMLDYRFLQGSILHLTKDNLGRKEQLTLGGYLGGRPHRKLFLRLVPTLSYLSFDASRLGMKNDGFFFRMRGELELELPRDCYLGMEGSYNTRYILLQGKGGKGYYYDLSLSKYFLKNKLRLACSASSFLPIHYTKYNDQTAENYRYHAENRYYQASFSFSVRYRFGKLKARVKNTEKTISNDDIKTAYDE